MRLSVFLLLVALPGLLACGQRNNPKRGRRGGRARANDDPDALPETQDDDPNSAAPEQGDRSQVHSLGAETQGTNRLAFTGISAPESDNKMPSADEPSTEAVGSAVNLSTVGRKSDEKENSEEKEESAEKGKSAAEAPANDAMSSTEEDALFWDEDEYPASYGDDGTYGEDDDLMDMGLGEDLLDIPELSGVERASRKRRLRILKARLAAKSRTNRQRRQ